MIKKESQKVDAGVENSTPLVFILKPEIAPRERRYARRETPHGTLRKKPLNADFEA